MENAELSAVVTAMHGLSLEQAGAIQALSTITEALIATIGLSLPRLLPELEKNLKAHADMKRVLLDAEVQTAYDYQVLRTLKNISMLQG